MKNQGTPMKNLDKTMKKHVFGSSKGSPLGPPDPPRAKWTKKNQHDKSGDLSFFLGWPKKNNKSHDLSFFGPAKKNDKSHELSLFLFFCPFCLLGVWGPKGAFFGRPKNNEFLQFSLKKNLS